MSITDIQRHLERARSAGRMPAGTVLVRRSSWADWAAIERLAALNGRERPHGAFLVAEIGEAIVAAAPLDADCRPLADPAVPTADVADLLERWAGNLRRLAA
jgi:hypothetical protein